MNRYNSLIILFFFLAGCSPKTVTRSLWQPDYASLSGMDDRLHGKYYDKTTKIIYTILNDSANLYIRLQTHDEMMQMKIVRAGMRLAIDTLGQRKGHAGIDFPLVPTEMNQMDMRELRNPHDREVPDRSEAVRKALGDQKTMKLHGFKNQPDGPVLLQNECGISVSMDMDSTNTLNYRAVIPLGAIYKEAIFSSDTLKEFTLCVSVYGIPMPQMPAGGPPGGGPGSMPPGGMNGRPPRRPSDGRQYEYTF